MMADKMSANLPMIKALKAIKARKPMANGKRAAAFNLKRRRSGNKSFFAFFFLPRAII